MTQHAKAVKRAQKQKLKSLHTMMHNSSSFVEKCIVANAIGDIVGSSRTVYTSTEPSLCMKNINQSVVYSVG
jgi:hypothetical protein